MTFNKENTLLDENKWNEIEMRDRQDVSNMMQREAKIQTNNPTQKKTEW